MAGQATRLRPLTDHCPKCLLTVGTETILARAVRLLAERGVTRYTVVDGFCGDQIRSALRDGFPGLDFTFVRNEVYATTNNAWSLLLADCRGDEPILLMDGDIVCAPAVYDLLLAHPAPNRLGLRSAGEFGAEEMKVRLDGRGLVDELTKEMPVAAAAGESVGLEVFSREFTGLLHRVLQRRLAAPGGADEYYEAAFTELARSGQEIVPVDLGVRACLEIDTADDLAAARRLFGGS